jgi:hypothetical protein
MTEDTELTLAELRGNAATQEHISKVRVLLQKVAVELLKRGELHDQSKLELPEREVFAEYSPRLSGVTFGSPQYFDYLHEMKSALDHHYASNRHHPQYFENGVEGMNLIDILEMLLDWWASTKRHNDGDILNSITVNSDRFGISPQLAQILRNTILDLSDPSENLTVFPKPPVSSVCNLDPELSQPQSPSTACDYEVSMGTQTK